MNEVITSNGNKTVVTETPMQIEQQANDLLARLQALGVQFGAVAIAPKTGAQVPLIEFLPEGWRFQIIPVINGNSPVLPKKD